MGYHEVTKKKTCMRGVMLNTEETWVTTVATMNPKVDSVMSRQRKEEVSLDCCCCCLSLTLY